MVRSEHSVSIGLPVCNGEPFLNETIESILSQTFSDFELIISDNASTDGTEGVCRDYAVKDQRVRFYRNDRNLGASENFNRVLRCSTGRYFKWAAHDDLIAPEYLGRCVQVLDRDPSVVMCHSRVRIIDGNGGAVADFPARNRNIESASPLVRFKTNILKDLWCFDIFGLTRTDILKNTPGIAGYIASDWVLRAELGLQGRFHEVPEFLFLSRDHPGRSIRTMPALHARAEWFDPRLKGKVVFPHWRVLAEFVRCLNRVPLRSVVRTRCFLALLSWVNHNLNWLWMLFDLAVAVHPAAWRLIARFHEFKPEQIARTAAASQRAASSKVETGHNKERDVKEV